MSFVLRGNARQLRFTGETRSLGADEAASVRAPTGAPSPDEPGFDDLPTTAFRRPTTIAPPAPAPGAVPAALPIPRFRTRAASAPTVIIPRKRAHVGPLPLAVWIVAAAVVAALSFRFAPDLVGRYAPATAQR